MKVDTDMPMKCCGKEWKFEFGQAMPNFQEDILNATCLKCGNFISVINGRLDKSELENLTEN